MTKTSLLAWKLKDTVGDLTGYISLLLHLLARIPEVLGWRLHARCLSDSLQRCEAVEDILGDSNRLAKARDMTLEVGP